MWKSIAYWNLKKIIFYHKDLLNWHTFLERIARLSVQFKTNFPSHYIFIMKKKILFRMRSWIHVRREQLLVPMRIPEVIWSFAFHFILPGIPEENHWLHGWTCDILFLDFISFSPVSVDNILFVLKESFLKIMLGIRLFYVIFSAIFILAMSKFFVDCISIENYGMLGDPTLVSHILGNFSSCNGQIFCWLRT